MTLEKRPSGAECSWQEVNQDFLEKQLRRLRLLLRRRVLWLRRQWRQDPLQSCQGLIISDVQADWLLAGEDRQAEARFHQEDPEAAGLSSSIHDLELQISAALRDLAATGMTPALEMLGHLFALTPFEREVLLLCLAPELDPTFERLYVYVQDDVARKYATPHMVLALFDGAGEDCEARRDSFLPEAPLRRFRLVVLEPGSLPAAAVGVRPLRLEERLVDYLRGINRLDGRLTQFLQPVIPAPLAPEHRTLVESLQRSLQAGARTGPWPVVNLTGPRGTGKRTVARALCDLLGLHLYGLDLRRLPPPGPERQEILRLLEREAVLAQMAYYLEIDASGPDGQAAPAAFDEGIEPFRAFLLVGSTERWQSDRETLTVGLTRPDFRAQLALWRQSLTGLKHSLDGHLDALVQQFDFGPETITKVVNAARSRGRLRAPEEDPGLTPEDLWQTCREHAGWRLEELAQRIDPCYTWEDIVVPPDVWQQLQEIAAQVAHRHQVYETWGFGAKLSRGRGISALFSGPSGTGKTMAAEILAHHLELDLYRIDLAGVVSKYIGETEKNLKKVFDAAEQSGAILFFDEADALFGKRTEVKDSHDRYANIEVNYLLQRMEDYRGLAILATNRKSALDRAFLRRLRFLVDFPFPDAASRRRIWQKIFPPQAAVAGLDCDGLARLEIAGGNIRNIALNAAFLAASAGGSIGMAQVMHAARREYAKIDKLTTASEFGAYYRVTEA
jgi:hypothetical protein